MRFKKWNVKLVEISAAKLFKINTKQNDVPKFYCADITIHKLYTDTYQTLTNYFRKFR